MLLIEYPKCSTCQKAAKWLENQGVSFERRHIKEQNPTAEELRRWHQMSGLPLKKFFNTSGMLYRELGLKDRLPNMTEQECWQATACSSSVPFCSATTRSSWAFRKRTGNRR